MKFNGRNISYTGDIGFSELKLTSPASYSAGVAGIRAALQHSLREMGFSRSFRSLKSVNQIGGFDCPGCAWPDPDSRSKLGEFCENGAKAVGEEATNKKVDRQFFADHSVEELSRRTDMQIGKSGRITEPFILEPGSIHYRPISWDSAFGIIADHLKKLQSPDQAIFYTSGRSSNEAAFLYGLFARSFGTNNMPDCSNMCHESSGVGLSETLGIGKGSVVLEDIHEAETIIIIGQNPGTNHPRMLSALEKCKKNGGKIISINPLKEAGLKNFRNPQNVKGLMGKGTDLADLFLQVKINQDVPLLKAIMKKLLFFQRKGKEVFDMDFIESKTKGYDALINDLDRYKMDDLIQRSGVSNQLIDRAVDVLMKRKKIIICWAMGLTQHKNGVENIKECVNLLLLKGSIGKKGAGTCPVRGHSNVQGDRTVGIMHYLSKELNRSVNNVFGINPPESPGFDTVASVKSMHEGFAKVFVSLGGNFVSAVSDTEYTAEALQKVDLTVSISTKLNRTHLVPGKTALILPTLGRTELDMHDGKSRYVTVENSMGKVHRSRGGLEPVSDNLLSEPEIVSRMAMAILGNHDKGPNWKRMGVDYDFLRFKMSEVLRGFENYSSRSDKTGFYLPNNAREADFSKMPEGRAVFSVCGLPEHHLAEDEYILMTFRSHDQFNTTIYGMDDRYRGIFNERRVVFMNPKDMEQAGLKKLDIVDLVSEYEGVKRKAKNFKVIPYDIPKQNLGAYYPETNILVPIDQYADKSRTPISKSIKVKVVSL